MTQKIALITGITGQDGSYLAELLLSKDYVVHGLVRRASQFNRARIDHLRSREEQFKLHYADLNDTTTVRRILNKVSPSEIYHLAGQSHVGLSFEIPESTVHEIALATLALLEICRDMSDPPKIYHASSSEIFGLPRQIPQDIETPRTPVNPYGCAKNFATDLCSVYRNAHKLFVTSGIAYNHESPRRGENFVSRKIANAAVARKDGGSSILKLGNLDAQRDWGYAPEYVKAMWLMLQQDFPKDHILATGTVCSVRELVASSFSEAGFDIEFCGTGTQEIAIDRKTGDKILEIDPRFFRKAEPAQLRGNTEETSKKLGWTAQTKGPDVGREIVASLIRAAGASSQNNS